MGGYGALGAIYWSCLPDSSNWLEGFKVDMKVSECTQT